MEFPRTVLHRFRNLNQSMEGNMKYQRWYNVKESGARKDGQESDLTLWKAASLHSSSAVKDAKKEAVSLSRMK